MCASREAGGLASGGHDTLGVLRLEFGIPVEIIEPALVQIIGRKKPPISMQFKNCRPVGLVRREHAGDLRHHAALFQITRRASGDDVVPPGLAAARARNEMIERQVASVAAVLAGEAIAKENIEARECGIKRRFHVGFERDDARQLQFE